MLDSYQSLEPSVFKLIGAPYLLNGKDEKGIDCIHLVYRALEDYGIPTPVFNEAWYASSTRVHFRALLSWGKRVREVLYNGDVVWLSGETPAFAVVWQNGILYISQTLNKVHWAPTSAFKDLRAYRYSPTKET